MSDFSYRGHRKSTRLQNWNYAWKGLYFVTTNTKFGEHYFGEIKNGEMILTDIAKKVLEHWMKIPECRPDMHIILDEFTIMPNHFHGIIGIGRNKYNTYGASCSEIKLGFHPTLRPQNSFGPQRKNLGSIMRGFKSSVTSWCLENHKLFDWQSRYYDVLIRDKITLDKVRNYIQNNVKNWQRDRFNKK